MRGHPLRETLLIVMALALLGIPLWWVMQDRVLPAAVEPELLEVADDYGLPTEIILRSAHPYHSVTIEAGGRTYTLSEGESDLNVRIDPHAGPVEIIASAQWPEGTPETALLIEVLPDGHETLQQTIWGEGEAFERLIFNWKELRP